MIDEKNRLKEKLSAGAVAFGTCIDTHSPAAVEIAGYAGLDFCRIDTEHTWRKDDSLEQMMRAARIGGIVPLVRVDNDANLIRKALEAGAGGVIVPHVHDEGDVREIVSAAKFPPSGIRGYGSMSLSGKWSTRKPTEWITWSNEQLMIGVMIEEPEAVDRIDNIVSVNGLDFVLFGPSDLSTALGIPGETSHAKIQEALEKVVRSARSRGKHVMMGVGYPWEEAIRRYVRLGCTLIELGHDLSVLHGIWRATVESLGKELGASH